MELKKVYENLCSYDKRSPDFYQDEDFPEDIKPRDNCYCDNCFHGCNKLAIEILRLKRFELTKIEINKLYDIISDHVEHLYFPDKVAYGLEDKFKQLKKETE